MTHELTTHFTKLQNYLLCFRPSLNTFSYYIADSAVQREPHFINCKSIACHSEFHSFTPSQWSDLSFLSFSCIINFSSTSLLQVTAAELKVILDRWETLGLSKKSKSKKNQLRHQNIKKPASNTWLVRYSSTDQLAMNGVTVGGTKYMFLSANDRVVRARKGQSGVHCIKTVQGTIIL